jgi:hypothetical protein
LPVKLPGIAQIETKVKADKVDYRLGSLGELSSVKPGIIGCKVCDVG